MPAKERYPSFSDANLKGAFFAAFDDAMAPSYLPALATPVESDRASETYSWLGTVPTMREWKGGRQKKQVAEYDWTIWNKKYESTLGISVDDVRRDKFGQHLIRASQLGQRAAENPILLLSNLVEAGESQICFDGKYFFDATHVEGNSGTNNNDIEVDISALPVSTHGSITAPSDEEMEKVIFKMVKQLYGFKDDQGQPVNQTAREFALVFPIGLMDAVMSALSNKTLTSGRQNTLLSAGFTITPYADARLSWTDKLALFRTDHPVKPFIHQVEVDNEIISITDGNSEYVMLNSEYLFGVNRNEAVGYGDYKKAVLATLT